MPPTFRQQQAGLAAEGKPSPSRLGLGGRASPAAGAASPSGSSTSLSTAAAAYTCPRTPETVPGSGTRPRSVHSGSATPSDDAHSLASEVASYSSAADVTLFAPASTEDAVHAVPSLLSQLLSGRTDEQVLAARKLHAYCRACGRPVEVAIASAGGVHMLLIMLDSLDRTLRQLCTRILTDMAADDRIRAEILSSQGGMAKVIQLMYKGILDGQASAGRFLELLATSKNEAVQAALCHSKVVRMLCKTLQSAPSCRARAAALSALQAFCRQDVANLRKLVWSGGVEALLGVLGSGDAAQHAGALQLLAAAVRLQADTANSLATVAAVTSLAQFVGAAEQPVEQQAEAADVLAAVAAVAVKRAGVQQALTDCVLPRAFEILHEAASSSGGNGGNGGSGCNGSSSGSGGSLSKPGMAAAGAAAPAVPAGEEAEAAAAQQRRLLAAAAAIVAQLVQQDAECCHSLLFHTQLLRPAVSMLISGGRFAAAQRLLEVTHAYAGGFGGNRLAGTSPNGGASVGSGAFTTVVAQLG